MLSIVFNYTIANLKPTYAYKAILILSYPNTLDLTEPGLYISKAALKNILSNRKRAYIEYSINIRIIYFRQLRDLFFLL
jgi:hypothetical protein